MGAVKYSTKRNVNPSLPKPFMWCSSVYCCCTCCTKGFFYFVKTNSVFYPAYCLLSFLSCGYRMSVGRCKRRWPFDRRTGRSNFFDGRKKWRSFTKSSKLHPNALSNNCIYNVSLKLVIVIRELNTRLPHKSDKETGTPAAWPTNARRNKLYHVCCGSSSTRKMRRPRWNERVTLLMKHLTARTLKNKSKHELILCAGHLL